MNEGKLTSLWNVIEGSSLLVRFLLKGLYMARFRTLILLGINGTEVKNLKMGIK